ncbi:hypothetical protein ABIC10_001033 [Bradyrhizobium sp. S3.2.12]
MPKAQQQRQECGKTERRWSPPARGKDWQRHIRRRAGAAWSRLLPHLLRIRSATMLAQRFIEAGYQLQTGKGFGEKANYADAQRAGSRAIIREGSNQDEWRSVTLGPHLFQKFKAAHGGHLYVCNDTGRVIQLRRPQEVLSRCKRMNDVALRFQKVVQCGTNRRIVVDNGDS